MKLTIITISYNCVNEIENTILSIIGQDNFSNIEYILIDGGSDDGTFNIINKYITNFSYVVSETDKGIADAFNKGIKKATGDIIGLINAGDVLLPQSYNFLADNYEENIDIYYGDTKIKDIIHNESYIRKAESIDKMKYCLPFVHQSCFISRKAYKKWGLYSEDYKICMDYELLIKMYNHGAIFKYIPVVFSQFSYGGVSYTNPFLTLKENIKISRQNGLGFIDIVIYCITYSIKVIAKRFLQKIGMWKMISAIIHRQDSIEHF